MEIGRFGRPHGVRGQISILLGTDRTERMRSGERLWAGRWLTIRSATPVPGRWLVSLDGVDDRSAAESLVNTTVWAEPITDPDAVWVHQVIGARVVELDGTPRGVCTAVLANPAGDLLEVDGLALVPSRFVVRLESHDDGHTVFIDSPDGLFEVFADEDRT